MHSVINAFRSIFCCCPLSDKQIEYDTLADRVRLCMDKAEEIYQKLGTATIEERQAMAALLGEAWMSLAAARRGSENPLETLRAQCPQLARIAQLRGECFWAKDDMEVSRQIFGVSLLCALGRAEIVQDLPGMEEDSFESFISRMASDGKALSSLEDDLTSIPQTDAIIRCGKSEDARKALALAAAARHLGGTYQNHVGYRLAKDDTEAVKERKILLCENAIRVAEELWQGIDTDEARWLLLTCKYNTGPYRYGMRHFDEVLGKVAIYEDVLKRLEELEAKGNHTVKLYQQRAQCYNMLAIIQGEKIADAARYRLIEKAALIALEKCDEGFDLFLSRMFPQNRASFAFKCLEKGTPIEGVTIEMIDAWHDQVQVMCAKEQYSHFYDAIFCLNAAKVAHHRNDLEKCKNLLSKGFEVCVQHGPVTQSIAQEILDFCESANIDVIALLNTWNNGQIKV